MLMDCRAVLISSCSMPWKWRWASRRPSARPAAAFTDRTCRCARSARSPAMRINGTSTPPATAVATTGQTLSRAAPGPSAGQLAATCAPIAVTQAHRPAERGSSAVASSTAGTACRQRCPTTTREVPPSTSTTCPTTARTRATSASLRDSRERVPRSIVIMAWARNITPTPRMSESDAEASERKNTDQLSVNRAFSELTG
jgi:hypothetical protein